MRRKPLNLFPPPLWGRHREGGTCAPLPRLRHQPPPLTPPHKGEGNTPSWSRSQIRAGIKKATTLAFTLLIACPLAPAPARAAEIDWVYNAYQRGFFLTAFSLATHRATEQNDPKAMTMLGVLYSSGEAVPQDYKKAAEWYKLAAERGDRDAMFALAMFRLEGRAGPRDREQSAKWLAAAAKLGHPLAAYDLALLYIEGQLFPQDFSRAADLLRIAANAGNPDAQYALGTLYKEGRGVKKDMTEAVRLFALAGLTDNTEAQVEFAIALFNGAGVPKNEASAATVFRRAALHGSPVAQDRLARVLADGRGAPKDPVQAVKWHLISKARGETDLMLDDFTNSLDAKTRAAGEEAAKAWLDALKKPPGG
jgi:uncharacterized protein